MSRTLPKSETISRADAIALLRDKLRQLADDDSSICKVAAEKGIFCQGFRRFSDSELQRRFGWIYRKRPGVTRADLEELANQWQLARQDVMALPTACDVQRLERDACRGWDDFSNVELERFCFELTGTNVIVE